MSGVAHITVSADDDGQRLDRFLKKHVPDLPYGLAQKLMRKGQVRVDGKRAKTDTRLQEGQEIRIPPFHIDIKERKEKPLSQEEIALAKSLVVYEDDQTLVLNKPSGMATQGGTGQTQHVDRLLAAFVNGEGVKPRLVHRLDKDTSGVLLLARSAGAARKLGEAFKTRQIKKTYLAVVSPVPERDRGEIRAALRKAGGAGKERMIVDEDEGKKARTLFRVLERVGKRVALVAFWPLTGRTHQIRVHAELAGWPILGDGKYGYDKEPFEAFDLSNRLHLHAYRIMFPHPSNRRMIEVVAPVPEDLRRTWESFNFNEWDEDLFEEADRD